MIIRQYHIKGTEDVVEAVQLTMENKEEVAAWCGGLSTVEVDAVNSKDEYAGVNVPTVEGMKRASQQDWVVKRVWDADPDDTTIPFEARFYVWKPGFFDFNFEAV